MLFKFNRKKFRDVVKVVDFLEKEKIEYEVTTDIEVAIAGDAPAAAPVKTPDPNVAEKLAELGVSRPETKSVFKDPLWRGAFHDDFPCADPDCRAKEHYGAQEL